MLQNICAIMLFADILNEEFWNRRFRLEVVEGAHTSLHFLQSVGKPAECVMDGGCMEEKLR